MTRIERLTADYAGTGLTVGVHPVGLRRHDLNALGVTPAAGLRGLHPNTRARIAGCVICRLRPETAKGFAFFSLEDETGIANAILTPAQFNRFRAVLTGEPYLIMEGVLQNPDGAAAIRVDRVRPLRLAEPATPSHDYY